VENRVYNYKGLRELPGIVKKIRQQLKYDLLLLIGELGAGKTTFTKEMVNQLGSQDQTSSPSYALINKYEAEKTIYHIDLYRLNTPEEAFNLGIEEILYGDNICLIEWPQIIQEYIEPPYHILSIEVTGKDSRKITVSSVGK